MTIGSPSPMTEFGHFAKSSGRSGSSIATSRAWST
jgi:hypothetical protein